MICLSSGNGGQMDQQNRNAINEAKETVAYYTVGASATGAIPVPAAYNSFGGWKRSLFGDQHMHGPEGVRFYTKLKTITSKWPKGLAEDPEFVMPILN